MRIRTAVIVLSIIVLIQSLLRPLPVFALGLEDKTTDIPLETILSDLPPDDGLNLPLDDDFIDEWENDGSIALPAVEELPLELPSSPLPLEESVLPLESDVLPLENITLPLESELSLPLPLEDAPALPLETDVPALPLENTDSIPPIQDNLEINDLDYGEYRTFNVLSSMPVLNEPYTWDDFELVDNLDSREIVGFSAQGIDKLERNNGMLLFPSSALSDSPITSIGARAFQDSGITSLDLSELVDLILIGEEAFQVNQITHLNLSGLTKLETIGNYSFAWNNIETLSLSGLNTLKVIGEGAFETNKIKHLDLLGLTELTEIGNNAFRNNRLSNVGFSDLVKLTFLDETVFYDNKPNTTDIEPVKIIVPDSNPNNLQDMVSQTNGGYLITTLSWSLFDVVVDTTRNTATIIGFTEKGEEWLAGENGDLFFPSPYYSDGIPVVSIGDGAFSNSQITSLDLSGLTELQSIGASAFSGNQITALDLSSLTMLKSIGLRAFQQNNISLLDFSGLTELTLIGGWAFERNQFSSLDLSGLTALKSIGSLAFSGNQIKNVNLSGLTALETIGESAFSQNQIATLDLSGLTALKSIQNLAFYNNQITILELSGVSNLETIGGLAFRENRLSVVDFSDLEQLTDLAVSAFQNNKPNGSRIEPVKIIPPKDNPNNLKDSIDPTFSGHVVYALDWSLFDIDINNNTVTIAGFTQRGREWLALNEGALSFPSSHYTNGMPVVSIRNNAFFNDGLKSVDLSRLTELTSIGDWAFRDNEIRTLNLSGLTKLRVISNSAFRNNEIESLDLSGLTELVTIEGYAFRENKITSVDFSNLVSLTSIEIRAFHGNRIRSINMSGLTNLKTIGERVFINNNLASVDFSDLVSLTDLHSATFHNNKPDGNETELVKIIPPAGNPNNLKDSISGLYGGHVIYTFSWSLFNVVVDEDKNTATITGLTQKGKEWLKANKGKLFFPSSSYINDVPVVSIGSHAFENSQITSLDLSALTALEEIGQSAFAQNQITLLDLSPSVKLKLIDSNAFEGNSLTSLNLSGLTELETIKDEAFYSNQITKVDFSSLTQLTYLDDTTFQNNKPDGVNIEPVKITAPLENPNNLHDAVDPVSGGHKIYAVDWSLFYVSVDETTNTAVITGLTEKGKEWLELNGGNLSFPSPYYDDGTPITSIGNGAFEGSGINSVVLSNLTELTSIGHSAFRDNKISDVNFSSLIKLVRLDDTAFWENKVGDSEIEPVRITLPPGNPNNLQEAVDPVYGGHIIYVLGWLPNTGTMLTFGFATVGSALLVVARKVGKRKE